MALWQAQSKTRQNFFDRVSLSRSFFNLNVVPTFVVGQLPRRRSGEHSAGPNGAKGILTMRCSLTLSMNHCIRTSAIVVAAIGVCGWGSITPAAVPYTQGFETDTNYWSEATDISGTAAITRVASGEGTLGLTAASGGYYAELTNGPDGYDPHQAGYGDAGYSYLGGHNVGMYPGVAFHQSIAAYLDTSWAPAVNASVPAFWIDMTASSQADNGSGTSYDFGTEHNFHIMSPSSGAITISADNLAMPLASISTSGWYTFDMMYSEGANASDPSLTTLSVFDAAKTLLGSTTLTNTALSDDLGGSGYVWVTLWQNGFAGQHVGYR